MSKLNFTNQTKARIPLSKKQIVSIGESVARALKIKSRPVFSVTLMSDQAIRKLNKAYRGKDKPTDILSFQTLDGADEAGDIFLAPVYIARQLKAEKKSPKRWYTRLIIHGLLHLYGYDHEKEKDYRQMFRLEKRIYNKFFPNEQID